ncbi:hypothetical protein NLU13_0148 [Sarocladium strictum]|uniref:Uncharacterized protein n=1 Tax=Sarocladium strictum TaxID=5046 RepID=A0AA39GPB4_SARSR|nr:hypothetical protein NLU13_0148 [Sarocladium strictum]
MAGPQPQAFLPSGGFDSNNRVGRQSSRFQGFPPPAPSSFYAPPPPNTYDSFRPGRRTSAPLRSSINGSSSSSTLYRPLPASTSVPSFGTLAASDSYSTLPSFGTLAASDSYSTLPSSSLDAAAYYTPVANAQQSSQFDHLRYHPSQRSSSLSPHSGTRRPQYNSTLHPDQQPTSAFSPPASAPIGSTLSRSVSADAAAPTQTSVHIVQRLAQQNAIIREAWEAERNYLEANRRRAEEVYQEERVIMEEVREGWEREKDIMLREMQTLRERIHRLEGENATLRSVASQAVQISGVVSPMPSVKGGATDTAHTGIFNGHAPVAMSNNPSQNSAADAALLPPGLDGASRRPHWASAGSGSRTSPTSQPEQSPFIPLEPRFEPQYQAERDPLPHEDNEIEPPIIDVQEVDPKLEGIPIKANAVQRSTFGFGDTSHAENSKQSSPGTSPPAAQGNTLDSDRPGLAKRGSSKDQTLQVLAIEESRRLTMHAGHTPNHSLSLFPTMNVSSNATAPSGGPTPKAESLELAVAPEQAVHAHTLQRIPEQNLSNESNSKKPMEGQAASEPAAKVGDEQLELGPLEPTDDIPLKGPLMIKNIPAQDEIFWAEVNKKLEPISQGRDAVPTVMRIDLEELEAAADSSAAALMIQQHQPPRAVDPVGGGDASQDRHDGESAPVGPRPGTSDADVPLKLKTTTNFGAPFGVA